MIEILRKLVAWAVRMRLLRVADLPRETVLSRFSRIELSDGSRRGDVTIGRNVMLHGSLISQAGGKIILRDRVNIRQGTMIGAIQEIEIGAGTIISNNVIIMDNNNHPVDPKERRQMVVSGWSTNKWLWRHSVARPVIIEDNVWIGQHSRINKGVTIGANSIVGANSVVVRDVPKNCIVAGNPARAARAF